MSENNTLGAIGLVLRPFFEDMDGSWKTVKGICLASLTVTVCFWFVTMFLSSPNYERAAFILNATGWLSLIIFAFSYGLLYWELHLREQDKEADKIRRVQKFTDVDKR